jgi:hypothetical protein
MAAGRREHENGRESQSDLWAERVEDRGGEIQLTTRKKKKKEGQAQYATSAPSVAKTCNYKLHVMTDLLVRSYFEEVLYGQSILQ